MVDLTDTIVSEATAPGRGAVRILRLSGPESVAVLRHLFVPDSGNPPHSRPRTAVLGTLRGKDGQVLDRCLALAFPSPASFTGQDCVELHLHGSPGVVAGAMEACLALGARPALPGEFSYRAFLGGKLSLLEAEATDALTACQTGGQVRAFAGGAVRNLETRVWALRESILDLEARMEGAVDFPDEVGEPDGLAESLGVIGADASRLARDALRSRSLLEGWKVALVGAPNAGKSSLFNALLGRERALVTAHAGTTRDVLSETVELGGFPLTLLDTAGDRDSSEPVERLGVEAGRRAAREADGLLLVYDRSAGWGDDDAAILAAGPRPLALLAHKADLPQRAGRIPPGVVPVLATSAVTGEGLEDLSALLGAWMADSFSEGGALGLNTRQAGAALSAYRALERAAKSLGDGFSEEVALQSLRDARQKLDDLLGGGDPESLYDRIFASFCLGK